MKKIAILAASVFCLSTVFAQDEGDTDRLESKKGVPILPEAGDIGLGVNAVPFLNYLGNSFNGSTGNTTSFGFLNNDQMIFGKYFLEDDLAIRGSLRFSSTSSTMNNYVLDNASNSPEDFVMDSRTVRTHFYGLSGGLEKRRGAGRVQGYYGGELMIGYGTGGTDFAYGNAMTADNPNPTTTENTPSFNSVSNVGTRTVSTSAGNTFLVQLRGFVGVEYFLAPKISIGGEFGWGPSYQTTGDSDVTTEYINAENSLEQLTEDTAGNSAFILDTDNLGGSIRVMFHF